MYVLVDVKMLVSIRNLLFVMPSFLIKMKNYRDCFADILF